MGDFVFNCSKGRVAELYNRVDIDDPSTSELVIAVINTAASDTTLKRLDTMAAIEADGSTAEVTNSGYARKILTQTDLATISPDDTNDRMDLDIADQTWTAVAAGTGWTDLVIAYRPTTGTADSGLIPLTLHDFIVTPDGSDITAQIAAAGFYRAS